MDELMKFITAISNPLMSLAAMAVVRMLYGLESEIHELNTKIAVILEKINSHEQRINRLEESPRGE